jgi:hypothetical protein
VTAGGAAKATEVLITPEEMDKVGKKNVQVYVPPPRLTEIGHARARAARRRARPGSGELPQAAVPQNIDSRAATAS